MYGQTFPASGPNRELSGRPRAELCFDFMNRGLMNDFFPIPKTWKSFDSIFGNERSYNFVSRPRAGSEHRAGRGLPIPGLYAGWLTSSSVQIDGHNSGVRSSPSKRNFKGKGQTTSDGSVLTKCRRAHPIHIPGFWDQGQRWRTLSLTGELNRRLNSFW